MNYNKYLFTEQLSNIMSRVATRYPTMKSIRKLAENIRQLPEHHMDCLEFMRPDMRHIVAGCVYADMLDCTAQRNYLASQGDDEDAIKTAAYMDTEVEKDMKILHILTSADNESLGNEKEEKK